MVVHRRFLELGVLAVALGLVCLVYPGPGRGLVRGHVGDVAATMLVYAAFGFTRWPLPVRAAATLAVAVAIEVGQLAWAPHGRTGAGALVIGSVFDPWDLLAYVAGVVVAVSWERARASAVRARPSSAPSRPA